VCCQLWCFLLVTTQWWQYHSKQVSLLHSSHNITADQLLWYTVVAILQQAGDSITHAEIDYQFDPCLSFLRKYE